MCIYSRNNPLKNKNMSCTSCTNSCDGDCGCIPQGLTTPNYCPADLPSCPDPSPCNETFDSKCVYYTGAEIACMNIESGLTVEEVIESLALQLTPFLCLECPSLAVPANAAINIAYDQTLTWNMVAGATSYDVYFGTSSISMPLVSLGQILTTYTPLYPLLPNTTYYWKIVSKNAAGATTNVCPTFSFTTKADICVNPLTNFFDKVNINIEELSPPTAAGIITILETALDNGEFLTNCNFCCPDCTTTNRYVLASASTYALYYTSVYSLTCTPPCCIEVDASIIAMSTTPEPLVLTLAAAFAAVPPITNCCGTNFNECMQQVKDQFPTQITTILNTAGVVEESTFTGLTDMCIVSNFLANLPATLTEADKSLILIAFLNTGFVVQCRPEATIISSVDTYITFLTAAQSGCLCYVPCSLT